MKRYSELTGRYISEVLSTLEKTNNSSILSEISEDLKFNLKFKLLMEELVIYALKNKKLINSFFILKSISRDSRQRLSPDFIQQVDPKGKDCERITGGITLFKGSLIKMLEQMGLNTSKNELIKSIVISDEENGGGVYTEAEVKAFNPNDFETILKKELEKNYAGKPVIINLN